MIEGQEVEGQDETQITALAGAVVRVYKMVTRIPIQNGCVAKLHVVYGKWDSGIALRENQLQKVIPARIDQFGIDSSDQSCHLCDDPSCEQSYESAALGPWAQILDGKKSDGVYIGPLTLGGAAVKF